MDYEYINSGEHFVFFLHGWGGDKNAFSLVKNYTIENYSMVFISFPGFGESKPPQKPYYVEDYANEVKDLIIKIAKRKQVVIVCHSFGARVAAVLAATHPELVEKIFIVDGAGLKPKRSLKYYFKVLRYKRLKHKVNLGKVNKEKLNNFGSSDYKALNGVMKKTFVQVVNQDLTNCFKKINCEVFLFWGEKDKSTPLYMAKKLNKLIKKSRLYVVKGGGHFSYLDDQDAFIYHLSNFLF